MVLGMIKTNNPSRRLSENVHLLRCTHPSSLQRTAQVRFIPLDFVRLASKHFSTAY
jgi:hypothetical protein